MNEELGRDGDRVDVDDGSITAGGDDRELPDWVNRRLETLAYSHDTTPAEILFEATMDALKNPERSLADRYD